MFPSPIGVLYISMGNMKLYFYILDTFPSPIGVLYISMALRRHMLLTRQVCFRPLLGFFIFQFFQFYISYIYTPVSVPYWGSLYFNVGFEPTDAGIKLLVSVPYWGSLYFNKMVEAFR